jgi:hypothetical protein
LNLTPISGAFQRGFGGRLWPISPDGYGVCGYDGAMLQLTLAAEIPQVEWPLSPAIVPETPVILDLLEFAAASVGKPIEGYYHSFFRHHHLDFERDEGLARFVADVNFIFARNGVAFALTGDGRVERIAPEVLREALAESLFQTGDVETDRLLQNARRIRDDLEISSLMQGPGPRHQCAVDKSPPQELAQGAVLGGGRVA